MFSYFKDLMDDFLKGWREAREKGYSAMENTTTGAEFLGCDTYLYPFKNYRSLSGKDDPDPD